MHTQHPTPWARTAAAAALALASLAAHADVASLNFTGSFGFNQEVHSFDLSINSASDMRLWTTSYAAGQVDPVLAFFDRNTGDLLSLSDDVDAPYAPVDVTQGLLDAGMLITNLAAGQYRVAVSVSPNLPAGSSWAEGYLLGTSGGNAINSRWAAQLELTQAVPEPAPAALLLAALALLGWTLRGRVRR